ncbi:MAG: FAD-dependent oxidoreductase [Proteobacteria bacterium]|nr:FAD-dependent oxidoreductase [Pseudomonadota bacterium]
MTRRIVVIGGVAAGPKAAARARRLDPAAQITILEKGPTASYGACGFPYYVGGSVGRIQELMETPSGTLRDAGFFDKVKDVDLRTGTEAVAIRREARQVVCRDVHTGETGILDYDKLIVATGAKPVPPPIPGLDRSNVFALKTYEDAERLRATLDQITDHLKAGDIGGLQQARPLRVGIIGAGLIGLEVAETLRTKGEIVTVVERLPQLLPNADAEIAAHLERQAAAHGVRVITGAQVEEVLGEGDLATGLRLADQTIPVDLVLVATGVRPEVALAREAGLAIGPTGAIQVDSTMCTSDPDIYAAGDCAEKRHLVTGAPCWIPLGSTANKEGRVAGANAVGGRESFPGVSGSLVMRFFDLTAARTGLGEAEARQAGFAAETVLVAGPDKPHFMPGAAPILLKLVVDRDSRRLLGVQGVGMGEVARRVDAAVTPIAAGMTVDQVAALDLVYAPPYASPLDVLITAANTARNKLDGLAKGLGPAAYRELLERGEAPLLVDVRSPAEHESLPFGNGLLVPLGVLRQRAGEIPRDRPVVLLCKIGLRGYEGQRILDGLGFDNVRFLEGGVVGWPYPRP